MKIYRQLSLEEREKVYGLMNAGMSLGDIGKKLNRNKGTLSRELHRNAKYGNPYLPCRAQKKADKRKLRQRRRAPLKNSQIYLYVREHIRLGWSPELIAGRLSKDHPGQSISIETIYQYIYRRNYTLKPEKLWQYLPLARKKRMKKEGRRVRRIGKIPEAVSIEKRPEEVQRREGIGHWETDNIIGKISDDTALSVTVERLTRMTLMTKLPDRTAQAKTDSICSRLNEFPQNTLLTLTADNGSENSYHKQISKRTGMAVYFTHAYASWEKGSVENMNGRIRRYIKKGRSIDMVSDAEITRVEHTLNSTPRKCLDFLTPYEKMHQLLRMGV